jgi:large repetitive protein
MSLRRVGRMGINNTQSRSNSLQKSSGLPGPVQNISSTATGNTTASISWSAPVVTGDESTISGYTVTSSPSGGSFSVVGTSATVTGLTANTTYTFDVTPQNSVGFGKRKSGPTTQTSNYNVATGGTLTVRSNYNSTGETWNVHEFTSNGTISFSAAGDPVRVHLRGGNGGGAPSGCCGSCAARAGYGGQYNNDSVSVTATSYSISIGGGGTGGGWSPSGGSGTGGGGSSISGITSVSGGAGGPSSAGSYTTSNIRGLGNQSIGYQAWSGACGDGYNGTNGIAGGAIFAYRVG